jgi:hypothetical protein
MDSFWFAEPRALITRSRPPGGQANRGPGAPRAVALAHWSSPRACSPEAVICYTDLQEIPISQRGLVQCGRHANNSMPMMGVAKTHPSCRSGVSFKQRVWRELADAKRSCLARDAADFVL